MFIATDKDNCMYQYQTEHPVTANTVENNAEIKNNDIDFTDSVSAFGTCHCSLKGNCLLPVNSGTFYESLKKLRVEDNYIVTSISTTVFNRVSHRHLSLYPLFFSRPSVFVWVLG